MVKEDVWLSFDEATSRLEKAGYTVDNKKDYLIYTKNGGRGVIYYNVVGKGYDERYISHAERK